MLEAMLAMALAIPAEASAIVDAAVADAAQKLQVKATVVAVERVTWRDGSLGCPQPGMNYTQALVPGWRIRLTAGSRAIDYHASEGGRLVYCPPGRAKTPLPDSKT